MGLRASGNPLIRALICHEGDSNTPERTVQVQISKEGTIGSSNTRLVFHGEEGLSLSVGELLSPSRFTVCDRKVGA